MGGATASAKPGFLKALASGPGIDMESKKVDNAVIEEADLARLADELDAGLLSGPDLQCQASKSSSSFASWVGLCGSGRWICFLCAIIVCYSSVSKATVDRIDGVIADVMQDGLRFATASLTERYGHQVRDWD
eukprot:3813755-Amphidinium_carterae.1